MSPLIYDGLGEPVEIAKGRGDLRFSSVPIGGNGVPQRASTLVDGRTVSYAMIFASQVWVGAAVMRMLGWSVKVPLKVYRRTGDDSRERLRPQDSKLAAAIIDPWERGSQADLVQSMLGPLLVHGNAVTAIDNGASDKIRFDPVDYRLATPIDPFDDRIRGWSVTPLGGGQPETLAADKAIHHAWWSPLGDLGISPLQQLGVTLAIEDAAQRYQKSLFKHGARPPSAVTVDKDFIGLDKPERQQLLDQVRADLTDIYSGPDNAGRPALLPPGLDWKPVGHTAVEAALIDQRRITREEICGIYQIPPPFLGILDRATFNNIEVLREVGYTDGLGPPLVMIEQAINAQLVRGLLRLDDVFVEFDFAGVLRGDRLKEMQALREAIGIGLMTRNEGRSVINMPHSEQDGMDDFYFEANNMGRVGDTNAADLAVDPAAQGGDASAIDDQTAAEES